MRLLLVSIFFFVMVMSLPISGYAQDNLGAILLSAFQCNEPDSETAKIRNSIQKLKQDMMNSMEDDNCQYVKQTITRLPDMQDLITRVQDENNQQTLETVETELAAALGDIEFVQGLPPQERNLYPEIHILESIVNNSRVQLLRLKAEVSVQASAREKQSQISGIQELNTLGETLATVLNRHPECFEGDNSVLKRQSFIALAGIAGYFMEAPLGVATTLVAGNIQNLLGVFGSRQQSAVRRMVQNSNQLDLGFGIGCAVEKLSNQHCNLIKRKKLFSKLRNQSTSEAGSTCTGDCAVPPDPQLLSRQTKQDLQTISDWVNERDSSGGSTDHNINKIRREARTTIEQDTQKIIDALADAIAEAEKKTEEQPRKRILQRAAVKAAADLDKLMEAEGGSGHPPYEEAGLSPSERVQKSDMIIGNLTDEQKHRNSFIVLMGDNKGAEIYDQLFRNYKKTYGNRMSGEEFFDQSNLQIPAVFGSRFVNGDHGGGQSEFDEYFSNIDNLKAAKNNVNDFRNQNMARLQPELSDSDKQQLATTFTGLEEGSSQRSTQDSLNSIHGYLEFAGDYLRDSPSSRFIVPGIQELTKKVEQAIDSTTKADSAEDIVHAMNTLVGDNIQFSKDIAQIVKQVQARNMNKQVSELEAQGVNTYSQEVIRGALNISINSRFMVKERDVSQAKNLSNSLLEEFSKIILANKGQLQELLEGDKLSEYNKNEICIQLIGLKGLNDNGFRSIRKNCADRKMTDPRGEELTFNSMVDKTPEQRFCALQMFKDNMDRPESTSTSTQ